MIALGWLSLKGLFVTLPVCRRDYAFASSPLYSVPLIIRWRSSLFADTPLVDPVFGFDVWMIPQQ